MSIDAALERLREGDHETTWRILDVDEARGSAWHAARGMMLLASGDALAARAALGAAIALGDHTPVTQLNLALAEDKLGDRVRAHLMMRDLILQMPDWAEPWLRLGESLRLGGDSDAACFAYSQALDRDPVRAEALVGLAALRISVGEGAAAQVLLLRCLGCYPDRAEAWDALGLALLQTGDVAAAVSAFSEAQYLVPDDFDYAIRRAEAAYAAGSADAELARLEQAATAAPWNVTLLAARGVLLQRLGRQSEAADVLEAAAALAPDLARPALLLAGVMGGLPRHPGAIAALRRAMTFEPDNPRLANNLGALLMRQHQHAEASRVLKKLHKQQEDDVVCLCNLANVTALLGNQEEAVVLARKAVALAPEAILAHRSLVNALPYAGGTCAEDLLGELRVTSSLIARSTPQFLNKRDPNKRLRVGLLSASLRLHPVGWLTVAGFENLDPAAFEIICLAQNGAQDSLARRFRSMAVTWHDIDALGDEELAAFGRGQGIDVLIDLGGYGDAGRMLACAHRLAPVQVKWVGMQNHSTGLAEMDWFISDRWETPVGFESLYSEQLLRLADGYVCYSPSPNAPDVTPLPALENGYVTFGCFNNLAKITPETISTWSDILRQGPGSRLILKTHQFSDEGVRNDFIGRFAVHGVASDRLDLRGSSPHREFMRQYNDVDIVLDPFPYTGGLTTCEALWMGVPTVTLPGEIFAARHSLSHLSNAGLQDWVAANRQEYVSLAIAKASDIPALAALRAGLRARVKTSPLCDAPRFGKNLGNALRLVWRKWCLEI